MNEGSVVHDVPLMSWFHVSELTTRSHDSSSNHHKASTFPQASHTSPTSLPDHLPYLAPRLSAYPGSQVIYPTWFPGHPSSPGYPGSQVIYPTWLPGHPTWLPAHLVILAPRSSGYPGSQITWLSWLPGHLVNLAPSSFGYPGSQVILLSWLPYHLAKLASRSPGYSSPKVI